MRLLRSHAGGLVRSQDLPGARSVVRRHADFPGIGGAPARLPNRRASRNPKSLGNAQLTLSGDNRSVNKNANRRLRDPRIGFVKEASPFYGRSFFTRLSQSSPG